MVDDVATIAEETTAEAETVAASAEEQTSALSSVSKSADDLSQQAVALSEALDRFETDADANAGAVGSLAGVTDDAESESSGEERPESTGEDRSEATDDGVGPSETDTDRSTFTFGEDDETDATNEPYPLDE